MLRIVDEKVVKDDVLTKNSILTYENGDRLFYKSSIHMDPAAVKKIAEAAPPNVVRVIDYTDHSMMTEYVVGCDLTNALLTEEEVFLVILQICDGLIALHDLGIIHRDINPSNIMLGTDGFVRIVDLESAVYTGGKRLEDNNCKGTRDFAAPEMLGRAPIDYRADIYSLGAIISYLTGNMFAVFPVAEIIRGCTAISPDKRFSTVRRVRDQICGAYVNTFPDISCYFENL